MDEPNRNKELMPAWLYLLLIVCVSIDAFIIKQVAVSMIPLIILVIRDRDYD